MIIIVYLVGPWPTFHRRPMLEALARQALGQATILCINPPISISQAIFSRRTFNKMKLLFCSEVKRLSENLYVGIPVILWPGAGSRWQDKDSIGRRIVSQQIQNTVNKIMPNSVRQWEMFRRLFMFEASTLHDKGFGMILCEDTTIFLKKCVLNLSPRVDSEYRRRIMRKKFEVRENKTYKEQYCQIYYSLTIS